MSDKEERMASPNDLEEAKVWLEKVRKERGWRDPVVYMEGIDTTEVIHPITDQEAQITHDLKEIRATFEMKCSRWQDAHMESSGRMSST